MLPFLAHKADYLEGFVVRSVASGSPAATAGLQPGDVVLEVNGRPIRRPGDIERFLKEARGGGYLSLLISRTIPRGQQQFRVGFIVGPPRSETPASRVPTAEKAHL
jgi:S1-C subfamily serine protease